jgi:hypothetical protein
MLSFSFIKNCLLPGLLIALTMTGCNTATRESSTGNAMLEKDDVACYWQVQGRDTIKLSVQSANGKVDGKLDFLFYEKDKSRGTIAGEMKGDTLFANYRFTSEGTESYRDVAFLKRDDSFVMGYGEILNTGNREVFRNRKDIKFGEMVVLRKVPCK